MKNQILSLLSALLLCACASEIGDDAKRTPIGSVLTGETTSTEGYVERVRKENSSLEKDAWRPESRERF